MEDTRSDETLALSYSEGDESAAAPLFRRYEKPLWKYALRTSVYRDPSFLDDIVQITFTVIFRLLKDKQFTPRFADSFKAWAFDICKKTTYNENQRRTKYEQPITDAHLTDLSLDIDVRRVSDSMDTRRQGQRLARLAEALPHLEPIQRKLFDLRQAGLSYEQIRHEPEFRKNNAGQLRVKYCRVLETLRKYAKRGENI